MDREEDAAVIAHQDLIGSEGIHSDGMLVAMAQRKVTLNLLPVPAPRPRTIDCGLSHVYHVRCTVGSGITFVRAGQTEIIWRRSQSPIVPVSGDVVPGLAGV